MKHNYLITFIILMYGSVLVHGQQVKIGAIDLNYIYQNMPAHKALMDEIGNATREYDEIQNNKVAAYQKEVEAYRKLGKDTPEPILRDKGTQLQNLEAAMQAFRENAERDLRTKYSTKFPEIEKKLMSALADCAKQMHVEYIFRIGISSNTNEETPPVLFSNEQEFDLTDHVLSILGVTEHPDKGKIRKVGIGK